eukprot:TRINITY_DN50087_c0_g1_i1.p1 TRINITY_DN50087_c0_g1~~TRINITY_DN50087_c0_g1_i1.p1  ORF type:complete len:719 (-),score=197.97 TRINITY_DN50087_c0_g1_i1:150-2306(-)
MAPKASKEPAPSPPPRANYAATQKSAEEAARAAVERVLQDGGRQVVNNYLEWKSYPFAVQNAVDNAVSELEMYFVPHDEADPPEDWCLGDEPAQLGLDSCATHALLQKGKAEVPKILKPSKQLLKGVQAVMNVPSAWSRATTPNRMAAIKASDSSSVRSGQSKERGGQQALPKQRQYAVDDDPWEPDGEDDKLRAYMAKKEAKKQEEIEDQMRAKAAEEAKERANVERMRLQAELPPCTYDSAGNPVFFDPADPESLPSVMEKFRFEIVSNAARELQFAAPPALRFAREDEESAAAAAMPKAPKAEFAGGKKKGMLRQRSAPEDGFTDGVVKPECIQPPISDIIDMQPGVALFCFGKEQKRGIAKRDGPLQLSRAEYLVLSRRHEEQVEQRRRDLGNRRGANSPLPSPSNRSPFSTQDLARELLQSGSLPLPPQPQPPGLRPSPSSAPARGAQQPPAAAALAAAVAAAANPSSAQLPEPPAAATRMASRPAPAPLDGTQDLRMVSGSDLGEEQTPAAALAGAVSAPAMPLRPQQHAAAGPATAGAKARGQKVTVKILHRPQSAPSLKPSRHGDENRDPDTRAPPAPGLETRHAGKQVEALGFRARAPRDRVPQLGAPSPKPCGPVQPPVGATMGHGLVLEPGESRHEAYYFPPQKDPRRLQQKLMLRPGSAASQVVSGPPSPLGTTGSSFGGLGRAPPSVGRMRPRSSPGNGRTRRLR